MIKFADKWIKPEEVLMIKPDAGSRDWSAVLLGSTWVSIHAPADKIAARVAEALA